MKNYLLVLLAVLGIGFFANAYLPEMPEAKAEIHSEVTSEATGTIEAMLLPEFNFISEISLENINETAEITRPLETNWGTTLATTYVASSPFAYTVTDYSSTIVEHPNSANIYRTGKLVYAHNSAGLFGNLSNLAPGATFTLTENGATTTYRVFDVRIFQKSGATLLQLCTKGYEDCSGNYMSALVNNALHHSVALMTCTGASYGNGDASHRLVVLADVI